jgi:hypothetical protein
MTTHRLLDGLEGQMRYMASEFVPRLATTVFYLDRDQFFRKGSTGQWLSSSVTRNFPETPPESLNTRLPTSQPGSIAPHCPEWATTRVLDL